MTDLVMQLHLKITSISKPRQGVLIRLSPQLFAALGLLLEQRFEFFDHLIHRLHHTTKLRGSWQLGQAQKLATRNGMRLLHHVVQWFELTPKQQCPQHRTHDAAQQQPAQTA